MSKIRRIIYFGLIIASQAIYIPLNRLLQGGVALKLPLDDLIPIQPIWAIPYAAWMIGWFILWFYAALYMPEKLYRHLFTSALIVSLSAMVFFAVYPTYVPRRPVDESAFGAIFLKMVYSSDGLYCAFPSGHIYLCTLTGLFFSRWHPRQTGFWIFVLAIVTISTLLTGQHFILDIPGGLLFSLVGDFLGGQVVKLIPIHLQGRSLLSKTEQ